MLFMKIGIPKDTILEYRNRPFIYFTIFFFLIMLKKKIFFSNTWNKLRAYTNKILTFFFIFLWSSSKGCTFAQRPGFRVGAGHPHSQRHLPKRPTDPPPVEDDYVPTEQCPAPNGFFPSDEQCDKYNACL